MNLNIIKKGISSFLKELYPMVGVFTNSVAQGTVAPYFLIDFTSISNAARLSNTTKYEVGCVLTYYPSDDKTFNQIEAINSTILQNLRSFETSEGWMTAKNKSSSIKDKILTVTFTVTISEYCESIDLMIERAKQKTDIKK